MPDGTLVQSVDFDGDCFVVAVWEVLGNSLDTDWTKYPHVTDSGILDYHITECGLHANRDEIHKDVKKEFTKKVEGLLRKNPAQEVPGAMDFLSGLRRREGLSLSIATGGWYETALMKLKSAKIDIEGIPVASSNDHFSRTSIMKIAEDKSVGNANIPCTYFGDGDWDKKACEELGYNFVLVGKSTYHHYNILDYRNEAQALGYIGLEKGDRVR